MGRVVGFRLLTKRINILYNGKVNCLEGENMLEVLKKQFNKIFHKQINRRFVKSKRRIYILELKKLNEQNEINNQNQRREKYDS